MDTNAITPQPQMENNGMSKRTFVIIIVLLVAFFGASTYFILNKYYPSKYEKPSSKDQYKEGEKITEKKPSENADQSVMGPGGEYVAYSPYYQNTLIELKNIMDIRSMPAEKFNFPLVGESGSSEILLVATNGTHIHNSRLYHPFPHIKLINDFLYFLSADPSEAFPGGNRPALLRVRLGQNREPVGNVEKLYRSGPGGGHTLYLGLETLKNSSPPLLLIAGEADLTAPNGKDDHDAILGAYSTSQDQMQAVKEIYFGDKAPNANRPDIKAYGEVAGSFFYGGRDQNTLYSAGGMGASAEGAEGETVMGFINELDSDVNSPNFLTPKSGWIIAAEGGHRDIIRASTTMMTATIADSEGNIYFGGRTDATTVRDTMNPYIGKISPDGTVTHKIYRLPEELNGTFTFGNFIIAPDGDILWSFVTNSDQLIILKIDRNTLLPIASKYATPEGISGGAFRRSHFVWQTLKDGKLYILGNYAMPSPDGSREVTVSRGFVMARYVDNLGLAGGVAFDSPIADAPMNIPLDITVDDRNPNIFFIGGEAGRQNPGGEERVFTSYILRLAADL